MVGWLVLEVDEDEDEEDEDEDDEEDDDDALDFVVVVVGAVLGRVVVGRVVVVGRAAVVVDAVAETRVVDAAVAPVVFTAVEEVICVVSAWVEALAARVGGCVRNAVVVSSPARGGRSRGGREIASAHPVVSAAVSSAVSAAVVSSAAGLFPQEAKARRSAKAKRSAKTACLPCFIARFPFPCIQKMRAEEIGPHQSAPPD